MSKFPKPTPEMIEFFRQRTAEHINRVIRFMHQLRGTEGLSDQELHTRASQHDRDKYTDQNLILPYIWLTEYHRVNDGTGPVDEKLEALKEQTKDATAQHIQNNRHHPEAHESPTAMQNLDLAEMVADWAAMADELGEGSPRGWADKNIGSKWKFSPEQENFIYGLIDKLESEMPANKKRAVKGSAMRKRQGLVRVTARPVTNIHEGDIVLYNGMSYTVQEINGAKAVLQRYVGNGRMLRRKDVNIKDLRKASTMNRKNTNRRIASYWYLPEDTLYGIMGIEPGGAEYLVDNLPEELPQTLEASETFFGALEDHLGDLESAVERVLDDARTVAKKHIDQYLEQHGADPEDAQHAGYWYKNMADDFAQEVLFDLRGGAPEFNEIHDNYLPAMFEWLEMEEDPEFFDQTLEAAYVAGAEAWEGWVVPTIQESWDAAKQAAKQAVLEGDDEDEAAELTPAEIKMVSRYLQELSRDEPRMNANALAEVTIEELELPSELFDAVRALAQQLIDSSSFKQENLPLGASVRRAARMPSENLTEFRRYLEGVVVVDGDGSITLYDTAPGAPVYAAIVHDGSGFNPGAAVVVSQEDWVGEEGCLQQALEILEMWNYEHHRDYYNELVEEYGEEAAAGVFTETFDGKAWSGLNAKGVADAIKADKFAPRYIDIEWETYED
jgi:hypothetical protein